MGRFGGGVVVRVVFAGGVTTRLFAFVSDGALEGRVCVGATTGDFPFMRGGVVARAGLGAGEVVRALGLGAAAERLFIGVGAGTAAFLVTGARVVARTRFGEDDATAALPLWGTEGTVLAGAFSLTTVL